MIMGFAALTTFTYTYKHIYKLLDTFTKEVQKSNSPQQLAFHPMIHTPIRFLGLQS
jgi:hypothetical protein